MFLNNESWAVVARRDPSKSHNPEIACQSRQAKITAKMAKAPNRSYKNAWNGFKKIVDDGHKAGTINLVSEKTNVTAETCSWYRSAI
eukprot:657897-Ditylum_brightwellii.AAC.1